MVLGTANQCALFQCSIPTLTTLKFVYDIVSSFAKRPCDKSAQLG